MTYIIKCGACGFKFFNDTEDALPPIDILRRYAFTCPSCFKRLEFKTNRISIKCEDVNIIEKRLRMIRIRRTISLNRRNYESVTERNI